MDFTVLDSRCSVSRSGCLALGPPSPLTSLEASLWLYFLSEDSSCFYLSGPGPSLQLQLPFFTLSWPGLPVAPAWTWGSFSMCTVLAGFLGNMGGLSTTILPQNLACLNIAI